jgi:retinol-binding protein 3
MRKLFMSGLLIGWLGSATAEAEIPDAFMADEARSIAASAIDRIEDVYVIEEKAHEIARTLRMQLEAGEFDIADPNRFAVKFNAAMRETSGDLHMSFRTDPEQYEVLLTGSADRHEPSPEQIAYYGNQARLANYGYRMVQVLPGNIGYLNLTGFWDGIEGEAKTRAAMTVLYGTDAIIIDVRENGGGSGEAVRLLQSYFFDEPTHVLTFHNRFQGIEDKSMTAEPPASHGLFNVPLYILTSRGTGSAAEDFSYIMKVHEKATLIGDVTAGAGHTVAFFPVDPGFVIGVSDGRPVSPVTNDGWEGVGVKPDLEVPSHLALDEAYEKALGTLKSEAPDGTSTQIWDWALVGIEGKTNPPTFSSRELRAMAGSYGPRTIAREGSKLFYSRDGRPNVELIPLTKTIFQHAQSSSFRVKFVWEGNKVVAIEAMFDTGRVDRNDRT